MDVKKMLEEDMNKKETVSVEQRMYFGSERNKCIMCGYETMDIVVINTYEFLTEFSFVMCEKCRKKLKEVL